ncbi:MAG TPA: bacillithiol system redox-active protein YtxJ [Ohtaekwangia sp.]|nr:bacillithiol system redox-active protein YtxJ [Ohtaekwangia sp.]
MKWNRLTKQEQIQDIRKESKEKPVLIFKHSTRCNISRTTLDRLERNWKDEEMNGVKLYFLDLLTYRQISNQLAEEFDVEHQSPQVLLIQDEVSTYNRSHFEIDYTQLKEVIKNQK